MKRVFYLTSLFYFANINFKLDHIINSFWGPTFIIWMIWKTKMASLSKLMFWCKMFNFSDIYNKAMAQSFLLLELWIKCSTLEMIRKIKVFLTGRLHFLWDLSKELINLSWIFIKSHSKVGMINCFISSLTSTKLIFFTLKYRVKSKTLKLKTESEWS